MTTPAKAKARLVKRWILFAVSLTALGALFALDSNHKYQLLDEAERRRLAHQVKVVHAAISERLQTTSNVLDVLRTGSILQTVPAGESLNKVLANVVVAQTGIQAMLIIDPRGTILASSQEELVGDRFEPFPHRDSSGPAADPAMLHVSAPQLTPLGDTAVSLGKTLRDADGSFRGYVLAIVQPEFFSSVLDSIRYVDDLSSWVVHGDGVVIQRWPEPQKFVGLDVGKNPNSLFSKFVASGQQSGIVSGIGSVSGKLQLTAFSFIKPTLAPADKPLLVSVSRSADEVFAAWHQDRKHKLTIFAGVLLLGIFGMWMYQQRREAYDVLRRSQEVERAQADAQLRESERRFRSLFEHLPVAYQSLDAGGCWLDANQQMANLLGFESPTQMLGKDFYPFWEEPYRSNFDTAFDQFKRTHSVDGELMLRRLDGKLITVIIAGRIQRDADGSYLRTHCILVDITERRELEEHVLRLNESLESKVQQRTEELARANEELNRLARKDALTGIANRLMANERLGNEFKLMKRTQVPFSVLVLDIDFFKRVNDTYGHETGDQVLARTAQVLSASVRETDLVARFGGEEFLVLLPATPEEAARVVAEKIRQAVEDAPSPVVGPITVSIGLSVASPADNGYEEVLRRAGQGLYAAKRDGRNRVVAC